MGALTPGELHFYNSHASHGATRLAYDVRGPAQGRMVVCVHGLTCNRHDFAVLANTLAEDGYRVIAVDLAGRGDSDYLPNPHDYTHAQYAQDMLALFDHLGIHHPHSIDWIGTSLGGLIGLDLAARFGTPITRLILNDIGPEVPADALAFIKAVIKRRYVFADVDALESFMREMRGPSYGPVTPAQWRFMAEHYARPYPGHQVTYHYDPRIANAFDLHPVGTLDLWQCWQTITQPTLALRGQNSLVFPQDVLNRMAKVNLQNHIFPGCGHVPSLMHESQISVIRTWLAQTRVPDRAPASP